MGDLQHQDGRSTPVALRHSMQIAPITVKAARLLVRQWHRHLPELQGGLFAAAVVGPSGGIIGVGIAGNPARVWQGTGRIVISRVAALEATDETKGQCSKLYAALCGAAKHLGYREAWSYTLPGEPGDSLRGAGFKEVGETDGGDYGRPSRARRPAIRPEPKTRWRKWLGNAPQPPASAAAEAIAEMLEAA